MRGSLETVVGVGWLLIAACGGGDDGTTPVTVCTVDVTGGADDEQVVTRMSSTGSGNPKETTMTRGGRLVSRWTYHYDDGGRLMLQVQDSGGAADGSPDGQFDSRRILEHRRAVTAVAWLAADDSVVGDPAYYTVDPSSDWVTGYENGTTRRTLMLGPDGRIEQSDEAAVDPDDGMAYTTVRRYGHDVGGLLAWETVNDSRAGGIETRVDYANATLPGQLVVTRSSGAVRARYTYDLDAEDRVMRAAADEDGDGDDDWVVDVTYAADGAVTTIGQRDGVVGWTHTFSAGCGYTADLPQAPRAGTRPGPEWQFALPALPAPY